MSDPYISLEEQTIVPSAVSGQVQVYAMNEVTGTVDPGNLYYRGAAGNEAAVATKSVQTFDAALYRVSGDIDDTNSIKLAHSAGDSTRQDFAIYLKNKLNGWTVSDELELSSIYLRAIFGDGIDVTTIQVAPNFGRTKKLFKLTNGTKETRYKLNLFDFTIVGTPDVNDPIGIYMPWVTTSRWRVKVVNLGNIAIFCEQIDNSEFDLEVSGCGYQPLVPPPVVVPPFPSTVYAGISGTPRTTLTAYDTAGTPLSGYFTGMVGKWLLVARGDASAAASEGTWALRKVCSVPDDDSGTCVVDKPFTSDPFDWMAAVPLSWYRPTGSISGNVLTISDPVLTSDDDCRPIWVCKAGKYGGVLLTRISVGGVGVDQMTITLDDDADIDVEDVEWFIGTPLAIGQFKCDFVEGDVTNDLRIRGRIENYHGPAMILHNCQNVRFSNLKTHGLEQTAKNIGCSAYASIQSRCSVNIFDSTCLHDKIYTNGRPIGDPMNGGCHLVLGNEGALIFHGQYAPIPDYAFLVDCQLTDTDSEIHLGGGGGKPANQPWVTRGASFSRSGVKFDSTLITSGFDAIYRTFTGPGSITVTVPNFVTTPVILDPDMAVGYLFFASNAFSTYWARGMFICGGTPHISDWVNGTSIVSAALSKASTLVTSTDGTSSKFNVLNCNDGKIALLNLTGASVTVHISREACG